MANVPSAHPRVCSDLAVSPAQPPPARHGTASRWPRSSLAAAAALFAAAERPASAAPPPCMRDAEKAAFDMRAVQSQLMVVALVCQRQDDYDTFVQRHQPALLGAYQDMTSHFRRLYGSVAGEAERDKHVTDLANAQSQGMVGQGPAFCSNMEEFVQRALALRNAAGIASLSATGSVTTVDYPVPACAPAGTPAKSQGTVPVGLPAPKREPDARMQESDPRDEEILLLRSQIERLERRLDRQATPPLRRIGTARQGR